MRHALGHLVEALDGIVEPRLVREREHVQHGVRRAAHRDVERHGVVDRRRR